MFKSVKSCDELRKLLNASISLVSAFTTISVIEFTRSEMLGQSGEIGGGRCDFELPDEIVSVISMDPFEQLDLAKKITSMAIAARVSNLEAEVVDLRQKVNEREIDFHNLEGNASRLESDCREADSRLKIVLDDNMNLRKERDSLAMTVKNLSRDIAKLETFKRQLIQSLRDENAPKTEPVDNRTCNQSAPWSQEREENSNAQSFHHSHSSSADMSHMTHPVDEALKYTGPRFSLTPYLSPWLTPSRTPKITSKNVSPRSYSASGSPKRTSGAISPTRTRPKGQNTTFWYPSSQQSSAANSPPHARPLPASTPQIDGKEFFRQARNRLSYEQFKAFLANIKELNAQKQTQMETLRRAEKIFGTENEDLFLSFKGLLNKNMN